LGKHPSTHPLLKIRLPIDYQTAHATRAKQQAQQQAQQKSMKVEDKKDAAPAKIEKCNADFVRDVTIPDGSVCLPNVVLHKIWALKNNGHHAWPAGTHLCFVGGEILPAGTNADATPAVPAARPGEIADCAIDLRMPSIAGRYTGYYRLQLPNGALFGPRVWIDVVVESETAPSAAVATVAAPVQPPTDASKASLSKTGKAPAPALPVEDKTATGKKSDDKTATAPGKKSDETKAAKKDATPATAPLAPAAKVGIAGKWESELKQLHDMGFVENELNQYLLANSNGDVQKTVQWLVNNGH